MPYCRIVRDTRGHQYFSLIHQATGRRGRLRQQLLYWFRTPPNLKIGRRAFDEETARAIEAQYPEVRFDWEALRATPPPPMIEPWRERRNAERAARLLRDDADQAADVNVVESVPVLPAMAPTPPDQPVTDLQGQGRSVDSAAADVEAAIVPPSSIPMRRRNRRRGRRTGVSEGPRPVSAPAEPGPPSSSEEEPANGEP
jgi:hypothetical protein